MESSSFCDSEHILSLLRSSSDWQLALKICPVSGRSPLHEAISSGNEDLSLLLIDEIGKGLGGESSEFELAHILFGLVDNAGWCLQTEAAASGCVKVLQRFLHLGLSLDSPRESDGSTVAIVAAIHGHSHVLSFLLDCGINIGNGDHNGDTPLHWACYKGHVSCVLFLIEAAHNAMGGVNLEALNRDGGTALHAASNVGHVEVGSALLESPLIRGMINHRMHNNGFTVLSTAAFEGNADFVSLLLEHGADSDLRNLNGSTALLLASAHGHHETVNVLLSSCNVNIVDDVGDSPLHWACANNNWRTCLLLLDHGADHNARNVDGGSPLHATIVNNALKSLSILLSWQPSSSSSSHPSSSSITGLPIDLNIRYEITRATNAGRSIGGGGFTAANNGGGGINASSFSSSSSSSSSAAINSRGSFETSLHVAAADGRDRALKMLLNCGSRVNIEARSSNSRTPLHAACASRQIVSVQMLLAAGADISATDETGRTPLSLFFPRARLPCLDCEPSFSISTTVSPLLPQHQQQQQQHRKQSPLGPEAARVAWKRACGAIISASSPLAPPLWWLKPVSSPPACPLPQGLSHLLVLAADVTIGQDEHGNHIPTPTPLMQSSMVNKGPHFLPRLSVELVSAISPLSWPYHVAILSPITSARVKVFNALPSSISQRLCRSVVEATLAESVTATTGGVGRHHHHQHHRTSSSPAAGSSTSSSFSSHLLSLISATALLPPLSVLVNSQFGVLLDHLVDGQYSDIEMQTPSGERFKAHRIVLAARCPLLLALLCTTAEGSGSGSSRKSMMASSEAVDSKMMVVDVPFESDVLSPLLVFLYSGRIETRTIVRPSSSSSSSSLSPVVCLALMDISDAYQLHGLFEASQACLVDLLDLDSLMLCAQWAAEKDAQDLLLACADFLVKPDTCRKIVELSSSKKIASSSTLSSSTSSSSSSLAPHSLSSSSSSSSQPLFSSEKNGNGANTGVELTATHSHTQTHSSSQKLPSSSLSSYSSSSLSLSSRISASELISRISGLASGLPLPSALFTPAAAADDDDDDGKNAEEKCENVDDDDDNDSTTSSTSSSSPSSSSSLSSPIETFKRLYNKNYIENKAASTTTTTTFLDSSSADFISPLTPYSELLYFILHTDFEAIRLKQGLVTTSGGGIAGLAPHVTSAANTGTTRISLELDLARTWRMNQVGGAGGGARPI